MEGEGEGGGGGGGGGETTGAGEVRQPLPFLPPFPFNDIINIITSEDMENMPQIVF